MYVFSIKKVEFKPDLSQIQVYLSTIQIIQLFVTWFELVRVKKNMCSVLDFVSFFCARMKYLSDAIDIIQTAAAFHNNNVLFHNIFLYSNSIHNKVTINGYLPGASIFLKIPLSLDKGQLLMT